MNVTKMSLALIIAAICFVVSTSVVIAEEVDAVLHWQRTVSLGTPVSGMVVNVNVQAGDHVPQGHTLLQLDDRARVAQVAALEAESKRAMNNRDESQRELDRTQELFDRTLISQHELDVAKIQRDDGVAQYQTAKANLVKAKMDLEYSTVRAPFAGWVVQRNAEVGQTVVSELQVEPLVVLVGSGNMVARSQMPAKKLVDLKLGQKASVTLGESTFQGKISRIGLVPVEGTTNQYEVDVAFDVGAKFYRAGQVVKVNF